MNDKELSSHRVIITIISNLIKDSVYQNERLITSRERQLVKLCDSKFLFILTANVTLVILSLMMDILL